MGILMRRSVLLAGVAVTASACSLLLDFDALQRRDPATTSDAGATPPGTAPDANAAGNCSDADAAACAPDAG